MLPKPSESEQAEKEGVAVPAVDQWAVVHKVRYGLAYNNGGSVMFAPRRAFNC